MKLLINRNLNGIIMTKEINFKDFIKNRAPLKDEDEFFHDLEKDLGQFPPDHNESWYFNFIDRENKIYFVSRLSIHMDQGKSRILVLLVIDGKRTAYVNDIPLEGLPEKWEFDKKLKIYCIEPMKRWRIVFDNRRIKLDINIEGRFPVVNYGDIEDPEMIIEQYGEDFLKIAAQEHYEQPTIVTGTVKLMKKREVHKTWEIKGVYGQRDHSWGVRKWVQIDGWNWVSAQFEERTINFFKSHVMGKTPQRGVIFSNEGNTVIENIEVSTKFKEDGKTPVSSKFVLTDKEGNDIVVESATIYSIYLPLPSEMGKTEIFEQIAIFKCEGKEGIGISEYLISTRD